MKPPHFLAPAFIFLLILLSVYYFSVYSKLVKNYKLQTDELNKTSLNHQAKISDLGLRLSESEKKYQDLSNTDQVKVNRELTDKINQIKKTYTASLESYRTIIDLRDAKVKTGKIDDQFALILNYLSKENYASASAQLASLNQAIAKLQAQITVPAVPLNLPQTNLPPSSGFQKQLVKTDQGDFVVDIISADLKTTKVIIDTASDSTCADNCPVKSLAEYAQRSGAYAGINGPYFCPSTYPQCAGKKNSFDTLLMNKNKTYFNSDNNVYSSVPAAIFSTSSRFVEKSQEWGRDTSIDSVIAGQPLLVFNGQPRFNGDGDPKKTSSGATTFIAATDSTVYLGLVRNSTVAQASQVLAKMGIKNAINLDRGGSTALWLNGKYLAGPGRDTPFGILLVKR